jgi:hypothetical protein
MEDPMNAPTGPDRWLHLRHPSGFSAEQFALFVAHAAIFRAYAEALLQNWQSLPFNAGHPSVSYVFFPPTLSTDRLVASLPLGGARTLGTRARIENLSSYMLWQFFQPEFLKDLEEGVTETIDSSAGPCTNWRPLSRALTLR